MYPLPLLKGSRPLAALLTLGLLLAATLPSVALCQDTDSLHASSRESLSTISKQLSRDVGEIANAVTLSAAKKAKRISTAVRVAVIAATTFKHEPEAVLSAAVALTEAASRAAPKYAEVIANAASFTPAVSGIDGASSRIRTAAFAAAHTPKKRERAAKVQTHPAAPAPSEVAAGDSDSEPAPAPAPAPKRKKRKPAPQEDQPETAVAEAPSPAEAAARSANGDTGGAEAMAATAPSEAMAAAPADGDANPSDERPARSNAARITRGENSKFSVTESTVVLHDDNVFFDNADKVGAMIYEFIPGVEFRTGEAALDHASVTYQENFTRYGKDVAPNAALANVNADFGYDDGGLQVDAKGSFQQLYQNNIDVLSLGPAALTRSTLTLINAVGNLDLTAKMGASLGVVYTDTAFAMQNLQSSQDFEVPATVYYKLTPKVDLWAGYTVGIYKPQGTAPQARDGDINVGARGEFTAKLSGSASVGYITRRVGSVLQTRNLGFSGDLLYQATSKTTGTLTFSRVYNGSALGQNQIISSFTLGINNELSPQWQIGNSANYQVYNFGAAVFLPGTPPVPGRNDDLWTDNFHVSYLYSRWLTATAGYTFRNDHSTISLIDFDDNVFSLTLGLRY